MVQNKKINIFYVGLKLQVCSLFCSLFQVHSVFRCVVMGANAKRCSRTQNEIIASKRELPVKNNPYSYVTPCYYITLSRCILYIYIEKGDSPFT